MSGFVGAGRGEAAVMESLGSRDPKMNRAARRRSIVKSRTGARAAYSAAFFISG